MNSKTKRIESGKLTVFYSN